VEHYPGLAGDSVLNAPLFQENILTFAVPYGLALQGLNLTRVKTSLLPPEITSARLVRKKKPWADAAAAVLLGGLSLSTLGYGLRAGTVSPEYFGEAEKKADQAISAKSGFKSSYDSAVGQNGKLKKDIETLLSSTAGRTHWLEVYKAIEACLPRDYGDAQEVEPAKRNRIRLLGVTTQKLDNLGDWYKGLGEDAKKRMREPDSKTGPTGAGYVFTLQGVHFHNEDDTGMSDAEYVQQTLVKNLQSWQVDVRDLTTGQTLGVVPVRQLGIKWPTIAASLPRASFAYIPEGTLAAREEAARAEAKEKKKKPGETGKRRDEGDESTGIKVERTAFTVQFVWMETPADKRVAVDPDAPKVDPNSAANAGTATGGAAAGGATPATSTPAAAK
ncbi:MAG: pilus assembly protein PilM, partial [Planctomycetaceae bacterium]